MKRSPLRRALDGIAPLFEPGRPLSWLSPLYEAADTALYSPGHVTRTAPHVRDAVDVKRVMGMAVVALVPLMLMAIYNHTDLIGDGGGGGGGGCRRWGIVRVDTNGRGGCVCRDRGGGGGRGGGLCVPLLLQVVGAVGAGARGD